MMGELPMDVTSCCSATDVPSSALLRAPPSVVRLEKVVSSDASISTNCP
jgi:hypothetical protein